MRLFGYYFFHTLINGVRKLFRTWVAVVLGFVVLCGVVGGVVGYTLGSVMEEGSSYEEEYAEEDTEMPPLTPDEWDGVVTVLEMIAGGIILLVLLVYVYTADKSGTKIFLLSDVQFLFTAPLKPQSVLLFRTVLQMGTTLVASVYLLFQIPNLVYNLGLSWGAVLTLVACWILTLALGQLLMIFVYTLIASRPALRPVVRVGVFAVAALLGLGVYGVMQWGGMTLLDAALWLFGSPYTRLIPGVGWLKAMVGFAAQGQWLLVAACGAATVALGALLVFFTWRLRADFYEDALAAATERQELLNAANEGRAAKRKKDRADRTPRDILHRGQGGWVFLHKGIANHHRFAVMRLLSSTGITYLSISLLFSLFFILMWGYAADLLWVPAVIIAAVAFFRNLGNPVEEDMRGNLLYLAPDSSWKKLLAALLAGSYTTLWDVFPALAVAALVLQGNWLAPLGWLAFILTMDFMVSSLGLLLQMALPSALPTQIHTLLQLMLKMVLMLLPLIVAVSVGLVIQVTVGLLLAAALQALLGLVFLIPAAGLLHGGKN